MGNQNNISEFILLGLSPNPTVQVICFGLFLLLYIGVMMGNLLILLTIRFSHLINQPMYFFLSYLSLVDLCYTSTISPKLIADLMVQRRTISFPTCMTQLFASHFFGGVEIFVLVWMAYDRFVAICKPLHYTVIMNRRACNCMLLLACVVAFVHSMAQLLLTLQLPFCGPNQIDHYFCDVNPLLKLACTDTYMVGLLMVANTGMIATLTFVVLLISYLVILVSLRTCSPHSQRKALSTCGSHITVVVLFFGPCIFIYVRPATTFMADKVLAVFYTIIVPMFNPLIYTLRNTEMKSAIRKVWCRRVISGGK
ncbi:olfactory receptor 4P4-like [Tachyglossus aculeatus]|uniref:olfactory receptor 4P4-like n=1 Tax=Tachyglossus aculeatus TaxID=9261 RepID=UPI0018F499D3|nr:olfactory receptor 4P4-like [Tachyglossus aculeatus]